MGGGSRGKADVERWQIEPGVEWGKGYGKVKSGRAEKWRR